MIIRVKPTKPAPIKTRTRRWIEAILYNVGIMGVGIWLWSFANNTIVPDWESWSFDHSNPTVAGYVEDHVKVWLLLAPPSPKKTMETAKTQRKEARVVLPVNAVIGRLEIPRLGVRTMVREGAEETTLLSSLGHIPGTALPGDEGKVRTKKPAFASMKNAANCDNFL